MVSIIEEDLAEHQSGPNAMPEPKSFHDSNFQDAMETIPLFMTKQNGSIDNNPALSAIQSLIYEGSPEEIAQNFYTNAHEIIEELEKFPSKLVGPALDNAWRFLLSALEQTHSQHELYSKIYHDMAFVHYHKENFGKCVNVLNKSLEHDKNNQKSLHLLLKSYIVLEKYAEAVDISTILLSKLDRSSMTYQEIELLQKAARLKHNEVVMKQRQIEIRKRAELDKKSKLENALKVRCLKPLSQIPATCPLTTLYMPSLGPDSVHVLTFSEEHDELLIPTFFIYPMYKAYDFIAEFSDQNTILDHLEVMFPKENPEPAIWDTHVPPLYQSKYISKMAAFVPCIEQGRSMDLVPIDIRKPLYSIWKESPGVHSLPNGNLIFIILPKMDPSFCPDFKFLFK